MNTARSWDEFYPEPLTASRIVNNGHFEYPGHLRLVVDNTNPPAEPVFEIPAWFDHLGKAIGYSAAALVIINIVNQIILW